MKFNYKVERSSFLSFSLSLSLLGKEEEDQRIGCC